MESKLSDTLEAIDLFFKDTEVFNTILDAVFASIDKDHNGSIDESEITEFIQKINKQMDLNMNSNKELIAEVFKEMDKDHSKTIDKTELGNFLRTLLMHQQKKLSAKLKKSPVKYNVA